MSLLQRAVAAGNGGPTPEHGQWRRDSLRDSLSGKGTPSWLPGKKGPSTRSTRHWDRDLSVDLERICRWGARAVVTLMEQRELEQLQVGHLGEAVRALGRTGLIAARLLMEFNVPFEEAVGAVRRARPGAIETSLQEQYLRYLELRLHRGE